jgi:hypothetical protein
MRLLANDLGPAKIGFLCYPFPSCEVTPLLDRLALRPDTCGLSNCSHLTLFQLQFVFRAMTLNIYNRPPFFSGANEKRLHPRFALRVGPAKR